MKQLELSAEKAVEREEKLKDKILNIQQKYKAAEGRYVDHQAEGGEAQGQDPQHPAEVQGSRGQVCRPSGRGS